MILAGVVAAFVIGAPLAALAAGRWAYDSTVHAEHGELSALHQVPAVLLTTATVQQAWAPATARAWWAGPGGARRTGQVPAPVGSPAGTHVKVWMNAAGWPAEPLPRHSQAAGNGVLTAMVTVFHPGPGAGGRRTAGPPPGRPAAAGGLGGGMAGNRAEMEPPPLAACNTTAETV